MTPEGPLRVGGGGGDCGHGEVTAGGNCQNPRRNITISLRHRREGKDKEPYEYLNCNFLRFLHLTSFFLGGGVEEGGAKSQSTSRM